MLNVISIFIGGGIGAVLRYLTGLYMIKTLHFNIPVATFSVNIAGSFILGFLFVMFIEKTQIPTALKFALTIGFCGGLTTFSTFSLEVFEMIRNAQIINAIIYLLLSVILCISACAIGVYFARLL